MIFGYHENGLGISTRAVTQKGMEHTTTALMSEVPLLHRRQKYIVDSSSV
jgi:hypothetical protein